MEKMETQKDVTQQTAQDYIRLFWWPGGIAGIFAITALYNVNQQLLTLLAHSGLMLYVALSLTKHRVSWQSGAIIGGIAGGSVAMIVALYKLIIFFDLVYIFNLVTQPLFTGLLDALLTGLLIMILQFVYRSRRTSHVDMTLKNQTPEQH